MSGAWTSATFLLFLTLVTSSVYFPIIKKDRGPYLWPLPQKMSSSEEIIFTIDPNNFTFVSEITNCDIINEAVSRYTKVIFINPYATADPDLHILNHINLVLTGNETNLNCEEIFPLLESDESYNLTVDASGITLEANEVWGILRGLETFSQLIYEDLVTRMFRINQTQIEDWPSYKHRGVVLNSIYFISPEILMKNMEAMAQNKMNVLHLFNKNTWLKEMWQDIPLRDVLKMQSPYHDYTKEEHLKLFRSARLLGIRLIYEFKIPGNLGMYQRENIESELLLECGDEIILKPYKMETYQAFTSFLSNLEDYPGGLNLQIDLNKFSYSCWKEHKALKDFAKAQKLNTTDHIFEFYANKIFDVLKSTHLNTIAVADALLDYKIRFSPDTIVYIGNKINDTLKWQSRMASIAEKGLRTIHSSCWNIENYPQESGMWEDFYTCNFTEEAINSSRVVGGVISLNGLITDGTNLLSQLWPDGSAVAERLWSGSEALEPLSTETKKRIHNQRCRMIRRGIPATPAIEGSPCEFEYLVVPDNRDVKDFYTEQTTTVLPETMPSIEDTSFTNPIPGVTADQTKKNGATVLSSALVLVISIILGSTLISS